MHKPTPRIRFRICPSQVQVSIQRCVWPPAPVMTLGEIQTNHGRAVNKPALAPLTVWLLLSPLSCRHTCSGTDSGGGRQWRRLAVGLATSCHASNNYLKH